ncbi:MAG: hypothetical protein ACTSQQ_05735 [Candidatus Helarchaeota archaeon]
MHLDEKDQGTLGLLLKIAVSATWVLVNIVIFLVAPIFIVRILMDFELPLNMIVIWIIYILGGAVVGMAGCMVLFSYGTKKRAISALFYTGLVSIFLFFILVNVSTGTLGEIEVTLDEIWLWVDVTYFSNILIWTVIIYGIIYGVELIAVLVKLREKFKHTYTLLKIGSAVGICMFLVTASFFMVVMFSATQIGGAVAEPPEYRFNNHGTLFNLTDDTVDITYNFSILNGGFLPIHEITFRLDLIVNDTTSIILYPGLYIGGAQKQIPQLEPGMLYADKLSIEMDAAYTPSFILSNTTFIIQIYVTTKVTNLLPVAMNITTYSFFSPWMLV